MPPHVTLCPYQSQLTSQRMTVGERMVSCDGWFPALVVTAIFAKCLIVLFHARKKAFFTQSLVELAVRVLSDELPAEVDALYAFCQTESNERAPLEKLGELSEIHSQALILISGEDGSRNCGWAGHKHFGEKLRSVGIPSTRRVLVPFPHTEHQINTLNESMALVQFCHTNQVGRIIVISPPFHQLRCVLSVLSCISRSAHGRKIDVYSSPAASHSWHEEVFHSQGKLQGTRASMVRSEIDRLWKYHLKGDLMHPLSALRMLNDR